LPNTFICKIFGKRAVLCSRDGTSTVGHSPWEAALVRLRVKEKQFRYLILIATFLGLFDPEDGGDVPPKRRLTFNVLQGVVSQNIALFITTAVITANPT
jgi:hypothetical protein